MNSDRYNQRYLGYWVDDIFYHCTPDGFFSCLSVILYELLHRKGEVSEINNKHSFWSYKNRHGENNWFLFFKKFETHNLTTQLLELKSTFYTPDLVNERNYLRNIDLKLFLPCIEKYFSPSNLVFKRVNFLKNNYNIDVENTIAVHYRGTDKFHEVLPTPIELYINKIERLLQSNKNLKILFQSDERKITDLVTSYFGDKCFYFEELPQSNSLSALHVNPDVDFNKFKYGVYYFASILIISQCKYVLTHVGNGAFWTALYRGNLQGFTQL